MVSWQLVHYPPGTDVPPPGFDLLPPTNHEGSHVRCVGGPTSLSIFLAYSITFSPMRMTGTPTTVHDTPVFCINPESWTVWRGHLALLEATLSHESKCQLNNASMLLTIGIYYKRFRFFLNATPSLVEL
jgi:hypothetical protein